MRTDLPIFTTLSFPLLIQLLTVPSETLKIRQTSFLVFNLSPPLIIIIRYYTLIVNSFQQKTRRFLFRRGWWLILKYYRESLDSRVYIIFILLLGSLCEPGGGSLCARGGVTLRRVFRTVFLRFAVLFWGDCLIFAKGHTVLVAGSLSQQPLVRHLLEQSKHVFLPAVAPLCKVPGRAGEPFAILGKPKDARINHQSVTCKMQSGHHPSLNHDVIVVFQCAASYFIT